LKYATFTTADVNKVQLHLATASKHDLFSKSLERLEEAVAKALDKPLDVPGQGEAGSYEHNQHKFNYELMDQCAKLYAFTGQTKHLEIVRSLLLMYADSYLQMPFHEQKNTNPPGRLFHQILNEHMWLFYASLAYSVIQKHLSAADRSTIETQLFTPMIDMFTVLYSHDFDRIHNHGIWAVAAVGVCALNLGDKETVNKAIFGLKGDGRSGGFLAQISKLFSRSGYYIEGPYYHRFAIRPLVMFAQVLHLHYPQLNIYAYEEGVIGTTIKALLLCSNPDGTFPALNDASLTMNIDDEGALAALSVYFSHYGQDEILIKAAKQQGKVWLSPCSLPLSQAIDNYAGNAAIHWPSIELAEGAHDEKGAQGFLRSQQPNRPVSQAIMAYGQHGMGHGHFDALGITLFGNGHEFVREYGFARWVNVETKFGGRYLDENKSWARQTVAHNGVTVDCRTQNAFDVAQADSHYGKRHFFTKQANVQAMSAYANDHYVGVDMQRTLLMLELDDFEHPLIVDLYRLTSQSEHTYDFVVHYSGQITSTNLQYQYHANQRNCLGDNYGYQHLFEKARATAEPTSQLTWLQDQCFHSWTTGTTAGEIIFAQTGANDPAMNLRTEDCVLLRTQASNHLFASTYETHGLFDEASESCFGALNQVQDVTVLHNDDNYSIVAVSYTKDAQIHRLCVCIANKLGNDAHMQHQISVNQRIFKWGGHFAVIKENQAL